MRRRSSLRSDTVPISWALLLISLLEISVWSLGVTESSLAQPYYERTISITQSTLGRNTSEEINRTFKFFDFQSLADELVANLHFTYQSASRVEHQEAKQNLRQQQIESPEIDNFVPHPIIIHCPPVITSESLPASVPF